MFAGTFQNLDFRLNHRKMLGGEIIEAAVATVGGGRLMHKNAEVYLGLAPCQPQQALFTRRGASLGKIVSNALYFSNFHYSAQTLSPGDQT